MRNFVAPLLASSMAFAFALQAQGLDPRHFAQERIQQQAPAAFALQNESQEFLREAMPASQTARAALVQRLQANADLHRRIISFSHLNWAQKEVVLREVFAEEVASLGITAPNLIIERGRIRGSAYFDFDIANPGTGTVILNPDALEQDENPLAALMLLIHETRHSAQFQLAFGAQAASPQSLGYRAAFTAQKTLNTREFSFSDFLTLNNELEAFQFGNYVVGALFDWNADTLGMGTYASQFDRGGILKIDLLDLFTQRASGALTTSVLDAFNERERPHYDLLHPNR